MPTFERRDDGVFVHARSSDGSARLVGRYRAAGERAGEFAYVGSWLGGRETFALDPQHLPLATGPFVATRRGLLPGVLADTTPDRWGRRLVAAERPGAVPTMTARDWLLATADERVGCLAFSRTPDPPAPSAEHAASGDLGRIAEGFERLLRGEPASVGIERLFRAGQSLGGARPKAAVALDGALWIAKFERHDDGFDQCGAEHASMALARLCGIGAAETRLARAGPRRVVLVKRFDRTEGGSRFEPTAHYLSALSALGLDDSDMTGSYAAMADWARRFCRDHAADREQLFRRMVFNVLCGNRDDHLKNHAFLYRASGGWSLSPAFDIVPQPDLEPLQAIDVGRLGPVATVWNCLSLASAFGLGAEAAEAIVASMREIMRAWRTVFAGEGVEASTIPILERAFASLPDA